jgi:sec-independent protein translocase protein TatA
MHPPSILQLVLIIILVLLLFGSRRVPEIMENLAKGIKSFKGGLKDEDKKSLPDKDKTKK